MRRIFPVAAITGLAASFLIVSSAAAVPPADITPYAGSGDANLLEVHAAVPVGDLSVADVILSPASTSVDTSATPRSTASGANLDATLLGEITQLSDILTSATQEAPPDNAEPTVETLIPVPADPVVNAGVSTSSAHARWPGDGVCLAPGEPIARGFNETAGADVLIVDETTTVATVNNEQGGVSGTSSEVTTAEVPGETGRALVSTSATQVDEVTLFQGTPLEISIGVVATPTLTATATGQPGGASVTYEGDIVTIEAPEDGAFFPLGELGTQVNQVLEDQILGDLVDQLDLNVLDPLAETGVINLQITTGQDTLESQVADDGTGAAGSAAVARVRLIVLEAAGEDPVLDVSVDVGPMTASAAVPAGGINCTPDLPECSDDADNDGDGFTDEQDPNCHTDGNPYNPDSYDPNDDDESGDIPECVDAADNDGDQVADRDDPGCHTDGDATNPDSFDPTDDREAEDVSPSTQGPLPRTGGDIPLAAAMGLGGLSLLALYALRRRTLG